MKPYPKYKDSGIEWIGKVPEGWEVKKIKHSTYVKGRVGWHGLNSNDFINQGPFLVTGTDFSNGRIDWNTCYHVSMEHYDKDLFIQLKDNDLLITKDGSIGKVAIVQGLEGQATLNSGVFVTRPLKNQYLTAYLYWILNSSVFSCFIDYNKTGSTVLHLYQDTFENFSFPIPPIQEQKTVCYYLDCKIAQIDNLISKKQKLIELLKEERAAIINQAVTKGLNPDAPMKDSGIEWLGEIPQHWALKKLKHVVKTVQTGTTPSSLKPEYYIDGEIDWFTPVDFGDSLFLSNSNRKLNRLAIDDNITRLYASDTVLLVGIGATLGKVGIIKGIASSNQQINAISFKDDYNSNFGAYYLQAMSDVIVSMSNAATLPILNQTQTKEIMMPVPPQNEQEEIVGFIHQKTAKIDQTISNIENQIDLLQEYRITLIFEVVTGKIDVRT